MCIRDRSAGRLQHRGAGEHRQDGQQHVDRRLAGREVKGEGEDEQAEPADEPQSEPAIMRARQQAGDDDEELEDDCDVHDVGPLAFSGSFRAEPSPAALQQHDVRQQIRKNRGGAAENPIRAPDVAAARDFSGLTYDGFVIQPRRRRGLTESQAVHTFLSNLAV